MVSRKNMPCPKEHLSSFRERGHHLAVHRRVRRSAARSHWRDFSPWVNLRVMHKNVLHDLRAAGVIVLYVLPLALVVSLLAGGGFEETPLTMMVALRTAFIVVFFAAVLGGTVANISGPTVVLTLAVSVVIARLKRPEQIVLVFAMAALLQILLGLSKRARFMTYLPQPVLSGFSNACAVAVLLFSLNLMFGHGPFDSAGDFRPAFPVFEQVPALIRSVNVYALGAGVAVVGLSLLMNYVSRAIPGMLFALVIVVAGIYGAVRFGPWTVADFGGTLAPTVEGLLMWTMPRFAGASFMEIFFPATVIALLAAGQNLTNADTYDNLAHSLHDSNREMWGLGIGNLIGALSGALPGAGMMRATTASYHYRGRTPMAAVAAAVATGLIVGYFARFLGYLPLAPLAGALFFEGLRMFDLTPFRRLRTAKLADVITMLIVLGVGLFADFYVTCMVAFLISMIMLLDRIAIFMNNRLISLHDRKDRWRGETGLHVDLARFCLIYRIDRPLAINFIGDYWRAVSFITRPKAIFIRMNAVPQLDRSALLDLGYHVDRLRKGAIRVYLTGVGDTLMKQLDHEGIVYRLGEEAVTKSFSQAAEQCAKDLAHDPEVRLYEATAAELGGSAKAVHIRNALQASIKKEIAKAVVSFVGLFVLVAFGFSITAFLGYLALRSVDVMTIMGLGWITDMHFLIVAGILFAILVLVSLIRALNNRILLADPGYFIRMEDVPAFGAGHLLRGCFMLAPNLLTLTFMEILKFGSNRFSKSTLNTATIILTKLPDQVPWDILRDALPDYAEYDIRLALAGLRAIDFIGFIRKEEEDFDIEMTKKGRAFIDAVEKSLAPKDDED